MQSGLPGFNNSSCRPFVAQIQGCDAILARMQEMLLGFQADLGGISDEIKHLQVELMRTIGDNANLSLGKGHECDVDIDAFCTPDYQGGPS